MKKENYYFNVTKMAEAFSLFGNYAEALIDIMCSPLDENVDSVYAGLCVLDSLYFKKTGKHFKSKVADGKKKEFIENAFSAFDEFLCDAPVLWNEVA